jgi:alanine racemase
MKNSTELSRSAKLEVDLDRIGRNFGTVRNILKGSTTKIACVLKADAYGHGSIAVAGELLDRGADMLAVAFLGEALELRRHYPEARILVMGQTPDRLLAEAVAGRITLSVFKPAQAALLAEASRACHERAVVHVKLDTGMNRLGLKEYDDPVAAFRTFSARREILAEGLFSHLALRSRESDIEQAESFFRTATALEKIGLDIPLCHLCDSIGFLRYPEFRLDMVRLGAILFGMKPLGSDPAFETLDIAPALSLKSDISRIRKLAAGERVSYDSSWVAPPQGALVATVPVGYADGYMRCLSNRASAVIRGTRAPLIGLICMDQMNIDVSSVPEVAEGDEVLLLGGDALSGIPILELARAAETNRNEIMTALGRRIPRVYLKGGEVVSVRDWPA